MVPGALRRGWRWFLAALAVGIALSSLLLLARSVENSTQFGIWQPWILLLNFVGLIFLGALLARRVWKLVRDYRAHVPGSRLTARTVAVFGTLVIVPLLIVYMFSLEFLNRGIDSWFRVEVKEGLGDALVLSRAALDLRMREQGQRTEDLGRTLSTSGATARLELTRVLTGERGRIGASEVLVFDAAGRILAWNSGDPAAALHARPPREMLAQISPGRPYVSLEPLPKGGYEIAATAPIPRSGTGAEARYVLALYGVPQQLAGLADAVQTAYAQYGDLAYMREPLKYSFRLTLTLVLLLAMLGAVYLAIFSAQKLTQPVQDLIAGTRAVGKGDFGTRLTLPSRDEMGFLVHSFNDMTKRLQRASEEAARSRALVEHEREQLAVILARLSAGVLAVDRLLTLRSANDAAGLILGVDLTQAIGRTLSSMTPGNARLAQLVEHVVGHLSTGREEWREQLELGDRVLMCACTPLPALGEMDQSDSAYVIVFDDLTTLLSAQREAAWGEVARRLAHEIKNPLTPIQLSAERLRHKLSAGLGAEQAEVLERSTHIIVAQVETMKAMVNAFSEYARAPEIRLAPFALNALVTEVAELYRSQDARVDVGLNLDPTVEAIRADRGRVRQILNNLIINGIEAVSDRSGGRVEVATRLESRASARFAVITVSDNGHGFQSEMLGRVFDPYVTTKPRGTGLGLAIVRKIVEEHGGSIEADNRPEGGARVRVSLPALEEPAREREKERA